MMRIRFSVWAGMTLVCLFLLLYGWISVTQAQDCSVAFSLNPTSGTSTPGGSVMFAITGTSSGQCSWSFTASLQQAPAGVSGSSNLPSQVVMPNNTGSITETVSVATTVQPGTYPLTIRVQASGTALQGVRPPAAVTQDLPYTLHVLSTTKIVGFKFEDLNADGIWQHGQEPGIGGWQIKLAGPDPQNAVTDTTGKFVFSVTKAGNYTVSEESRAGWRATTPTSVQVPVQLTPNESIPEIDFGNQRVSIPTIILVAPVSGTVFIPAAGESVAFGGQVHEEIHLRPTPDVPGGSCTDVTVVTHWDEMFGVGLLSRELYQVKGTTYSSQRDCGPNVLRFSIEIDGIFVNGVHKVEGIAEESDIVKYQDGDDQTDRQRPGRKVPTLIEGVINPSVPSALFRVTVLPQ